MKRKIKAESTMPKTPDTSVTFQVRLPVILLMLPTQKWSSTATRTARDF
jgi:hypothetical protein